MRRPTGKQAVWSLVVAIATGGLLSAGCGMNRRYANGQIHQLPHTSVAIKYAWDEPVGEEVPQSEVTNTSQPPRIMTVTYPHPSPKYGRKYAEVTVQSEPSAEEAAVAGAISQLVTNPFKSQAGETAADDNVLRLTIPREELEFLLRDLVADSYFDHEQRQGGIQLTVMLGSRTTRKAWDRIASFDQLAQRVIELNSHRVPTKSDKIIPASAELLPPTEELAEPAEQVRGPGRHHSTPQF